MQPGHAAQGLGQKEESKRFVGRGFLRKGGPASPLGCNALDTSCPSFFCSHTNIYFASHS